MVFLYAVYFSEKFKREEYNALFEIVSKKRKNRIQKFYFNADKIRCLLAEVLLRYSLWKHYKIIDDDISYQYNEFGKPYLKKYKNIHFNLSHSGEWVLCGVGDNPLGVDVEKIKDIDINIAKRFYTNNEYNYILQQPDGKREYAFYELWTLKESYIKAVGKGHNIALNSFSFVKINNIIRLFHNNKIQNSFLFLNGQLDMKHHTAVCVENEVDDIEIQIVEIKVGQLLEWKLNIWNLKNSCIE